METMTTAKIAVQKEMLEDVAPELVAEFDRMVGVLEGVREGVKLAERDLGYTRPHMHQTKFMQGIVSGGDSALSYIKKALLV